jgi:hypothetical protein
MKWLIAIFESVMLAREAEALARQNKYKEVRKLMLGEKRV